MDELEKWVEIGGWLQVGVIVTLGKIARARAHTDTHTSATIVTFAR